MRFRLRVQTASRQERGGELGRDGARARDPIRAHGVSKTVLRKAGVGEAGFLQLTPHTHRRRHQAPAPVDGGHALVERRRVRPPHESAVGLQGG